ncbi:outer membrane beta-barrel protein [Eionea flava]
MKYYFAAMFASLSFSVSNVFAQEQEPAAIYVGPFDVTPTLGVNAERNDNVFLEQAGNETSSTLTRITPQLSAVADNEVTRYEIAYGLENGRYSGIDSNDYTDHTLEGKLGWRPSIRHLIELGVSEVRGHDERTVDSVTTGLNLTELDKTKRRGLSANYTFGSEGARGQVVIGFTTNSLRYTTNQSETNILESDTDSVSARFSVGVGASTRALVEVRRSENTFRANSANDREDRSYSVGVEWEITDLIKGELSVGRANNNLVNQVGDTSSSVGEASIIWSPVDHSSLTLTANKSAENSENNIGSFVDRNSVELGWRYDFNDRFSTTTTLGRQRDTFVDANRQDTTNESQIQVNYAFRRWMSLGLGLSREKRASSDSSRDYDNNKLILSISSSL